MYEVLSRIELPSEADIPDAAAYVDDKPASWTIPHTGITLVRVEDGPRARQFLFSSSAVVRAREFYEKVRTLPYRRDIPLKNYAEMRPYLSESGWMISSRSIEGFPDWLKRGVYQQAVWKWIALLILIAVAAVVIVFTHRLARRGVSGRCAGACLRRLATPLMLLLIPLLLDVANQQLTLTGWVSAGVTLLAVAITLYVSSQLGAPLYGLIAGLGVGGIAIALAAQPTIENFIGSLNLFADRPVRVGDFCRFGEAPTPDWQRVGTIESIGLRSTKIRGIDDSVTTIPNADFSKMHIVNYAMRRCGPGVLPRNCHSRLSPTITAKRAVTRLTILRKDRRRPVDDRA